MDLVRQILTDPSVWPHIGDDYAGDPEVWRPNADERIIYLLATEGDEVIGLFTFLPRSTVLWEAHVVLHRRRRVKGTTIAAAALRWLFEHTSAQRIVAEVPACNRLAVQLTGRVMRLIGRNPRSFAKHGQLQDLVLFGLSKCQL